MIKSDKLSAKQRRIAKMKIKGNSNKQIAQIEYPEAKPESGAVLVSTQLNKPHVAKYVEQSKTIALKELGITWLRIIGPVNRALEFEEGDPVQNINIQLKASKQAAEYMQSKEFTVDEAKDQLKTLPQDINEIQLVRLLKGK